jgi:phosphatidate cytidylyltransferase
MLAHRLATGFALIALFLGVLFVDEYWFAPWYPLWGLLTTAIMGMTALEMVGLLNSTSARPSGNTVFGGVLAIGLANWFPHLAEHFFVDSRLPLESSYQPMEAINALAWPLWAFAGVVMVSFLAQSVQFFRPGGTMATISGTVLATAYVGLLGSFAVQMRWLDGPHHGLVPLVAMMAAAKGSDAGAYTFGRIAGRRKLWPVLSPNKTVEGAIGGLFLGTVAALIIFAVARFARMPTPNWIACVGFGLLVGAAAMLGDLMESMIKRDCARKDASDTLPGFGGMLDVMDSLLFAGPVAYGYWLLFGP